MSESKPHSSSSDFDAKLQDEIEAALGDISLEDMVDLPSSSRLGKAAPPSTPGPGSESSSAGKDAAASASEQSSSPAPPASFYKPAPSTMGRPQPAKGQRGQAQRERRTGAVVNVHGRDVFIEFSPREQGVCPLDNFEGMPKLGESFEFIINRFDADDGLFILSRKGTIAKSDWENLAVGQSVEARCTGVNKGGLEMEIAHHKAFMPAGQVDIRHVDKLEVFIGEKMPCEIIELDKRKGRLILSRRSHLETERGHLREELMKTLDVGQDHPAVITSIKAFGAFADLGGIDGLIHISDLSYERIKDPSEVVKVGDQVNVRVLKIDESQTPPRIGLGLKQMQADPYADSLSKLEVGESVTGRVTKLMPFGAFMEISPGVEGLIHISELSHNRISRPDQAVKQGEIVTVKITAIDPDQKRISLSLKALKEDGYAMAGDAGGHSGSGDRGGKGRGKGGKRQDEPARFLREEDPAMRKLRAQLASKFGDDLMGGIG